MIINVILSLISANLLIFIIFLSKKIQKIKNEKCVLDQQLVQSQKLAAIGQLSSGIAHEINNPLAIINQEAEISLHLLDSTNLKFEEQNKELKDSLSQIKIQIKRCREITHRLLSFARKNDPIIQQTDVNALIEDMALLVEKEAKLKSIVLIRKYSPELPLINTDPPLLRQVILNLLNNAMQAIEKEGEIFITTSFNPSKIEISIKDTGSGISKRNLDKIFDPFFTTKPPGKGTGLGLSICIAIINKLGGNINVESKEGQGSNFIINLPIFYTF
ncbi:MAG: ATP-binding protein [Desulfobacterales bacterium]|nr:ATP-binding protein [Desulfobacterales bacterium]MBF0398077.1 ATP-binding protein [Desulfobacterales bacterium]